MLGGVNTVDSVFTTVTQTGGVLTNNEEKVPKSIMALDMLVLPH